ncbi:MAG: preprotein translocase subunit SecG [Candidatus Gottesmanbacteria bacterium]|nr:preprotein translocase subunit SecG [Candidatus Gottesmanbacteria bacterium]
MKIALLSVHIIITVILITLILLQNSKGGLQSGIGDGQLYRSRRGAERIVFIGTIVIAALFFVTSIINLIIR